MAMLERYLSLLSEPKRSLRIDSLTSLYTHLSSNPSTAHGFASHNCITLLFHCLHTIKKGAQKRSKVSKPEICLSLKLLSLLAINVVSGGGHAHHVFDESLPVLSQAFLHFQSSGSDSEAVLDILDCLSFVGFFGSTHPEDTQRVMLVVWDCLTKNGDKLSDLIRLKAVSAWSFLLSSMPGSHVNRTYWKSVTSYFLNLMADDGVACAVADALALILEMGCLNKFQEQAEEGGSYKDKIKDQVPSKLQGMAIHENEDDGRIIIVIAKQVAKGLTLSKVSEVIQCKFIRGFQGQQGFTAYLQHNMNMQKLFKLKQKADPDNDDDDDKLLNNPEREEVTVRFYSPQNQGRKEHRYDDILPFVSGKEKEVQKRMLMSPSSARNKARSQLLKKNRDVKTSVASGAAFDP